MAYVPIGERNRRIRALTGGYNSPQAKARYSSTLPTPTTGPDPNKNPELFDRFEDGTVVRWDKWGGTGREGNVIAGRYKVGGGVGAKHDPTMVGDSVLGAQRLWKQRFDALPANSRAQYDMMQDRIRKATTGDQREWAGFDWGDWQGETAPPGSGNGLMQRRPAGGSGSPSGVAPRSMAGGGGNGLMMPRTMARGLGAGGPGAAVPQRQEPTSPAARMARGPDALTGMTRSAVPKLDRSFATGNGLMARREAAPGVGTGEELPGVSGRLETMLESDSPYLDRARTRGLQHANRRGLMSSSIAAGASEAAAIDAALPIAQADASIAANERAMRSQEFQQYRSIRSQELMQQRGLDREAAEQQANRELQLLLQQGSQAFQGEQSALQREFAGQQAALDRRAAEIAQEKGIDAAAARQEAQNEFAQTQADLDREASRIAQEKGISHAEALAEASRNAQTQIAKDSAIRDINAEYQRNINALSLNTEIPIEERRALEDHFAYIRDQMIVATERIYGYDAGQTSARAPTEQEAEEQEAA